MFLVRLPVNSRRLEKSGGVKSYTWTFNCMNGQLPNPCVVQGSALLMVITTVIFSSPCNNQQVGNRHHSQTVATPPPYTKPRPPPRLPRQAVH